MKMKLITIFLIASCAVAARSYAQNESKNPPSATDAAGVSSTPATNGGVTPEQMERNRISAERAALSTALESQRRACYQKLAVTPCLQNAKAEYNSRMLDLKRQEVALNDERRKQAAAQRLAEIDARNSPQAQLERAQRRGKALEDARSKELARQDKAAAQQAPKVSDAKARPAVSEQQRAKEAAARKAERDAQAAAHASQAREREQAAAERKAKFERRQAENKKAPAAPLPVPN